MFTYLVAAFTAGLFLAIANYLVLWFTVKRLVHSRSPAILALASLLSRMAAVVLGFYMATGGDPAGLAACVGGFLLVRAVAVRRMALTSADGRGPG